MPAGKKDEDAHDEQRKTPEVATPGFFYSIWLRNCKGMEFAMRSVKKQSVLTCNELCDTIMQI